MQDIGGYFSLEYNQFDNMPHSDGILLNSGRNCLEFILRSLPKVDKLYIPYFTCEVVLEPLKHLGLDYSFYHINEKFELVEELDLYPNEYLLYTNYFGIKDVYVQHLDKIYRDNLIVDNAQAFYAKQTSHAAYSPRKFVGVPDGGIAYTKDPIDVKEFPVDKSYDRCSHLLKRLDVDAGWGYSDFQKNDRRLDNYEIKQMSHLTSSLLNGVDFEHVRKIRKSNYSYMHEILKGTNQLVLPSIDSFECPMVYPYMISEAKQLRQKLIQNHIFVATYWPNVFEWCQEKMSEYLFSQNILALPIDQRYTKDDMNTILKYIIK